MLGKTGEPQTANDGGNASKGDVGLPELLVCVRHGLERRPRKLALYVSNELVAQGQQLGRGDDKHNHELAAPVQRDSAKSKLGRSLEPRCKVAHEVRPCLAAGVGHDSQIQAGVEEVEVQLARGRPALEHERLERLLQMPQRRLDVLRQGDGNPRASVGALQHV